MLNVNSVVISGLLKLIGGILKPACKLILSICKLLSFSVLYVLLGVLLYAVWDFNPFDGSIFAILYLIGFALTVVLSILFAYTRAKKNAKKDAYKNMTTAERNGWQERRKLKKEQKEAQAREEELRTERLQKEEELRAQERRLEELRAERLQEEILREERLIATYRQEAGDAALKRYEDVVNPHPIMPGIVNTTEEINYFGAPISPVRKPETEQNGIEIPPRSDETPDIYMSRVEENILIHEYSDRFEVYRLNGGEKTLERIEYKG